VHRFMLHCQCLYALWTWNVQGLQAAAFIRAAWQQAVDWKGYGDRLKGAWRSCVLGMLWFLGLWGTGL
jgi:hypothetical protein